MQTAKSVKDVMVNVSNYPKLESTASLKYAIEIIKRSIINSSRCIKPVVGLVFDGHKLVGTLRLRDVLKGLEPSFLRPATKAQGYVEHKMELSIIWDALFDEESKRLARRPVKDVMNPITVAVNRNDSVIKAACLMINNDLLVIPVLNDEKKLVGLVRMIELFDELSNRILDCKKNNVISLNRYSRLTIRRRLRNPVV